mgnify:CR=1 FL=1
MVYRGLIAIVFILFFIRDLDQRVVTTDKKVDSNFSTVAKLDEKIEPFKQEVEGRIQKLNSDVDELQTKFGDYERMMAVMELKRAMVTIQEVMGGSDQEVKSKAGMVINSIQSLLGELGSGSSDSKTIVSAPSALDSTSEDKSIVEKEVVEETISVEEETVSDGEEEVLTEEEIVSTAEEPVAQEVADEVEGLEDEEGEGLEVEAGESELVQDTIPSIGPASGMSVGKIDLSEGDEELPSIDDLLSDG